MTTSTANPLVAGPVNTSSPLAGTMLLESLGDYAQALESGSWLEVGLAGFGVAMDTAAAVMDPIGQLLAAGLGWLMEHMEPLKGWLNDLTGDAGAVAGFAATWENIKAALAAAAEELDRLVRADLAAMSGAAVAAYAQYAGDFGANIRAVSGAAGAVATALKVCSTVVQVVHDLVRDALAELVGAAIAWVAEIALTVGLGTPWVVSQVATRVSSLATRVGTKVTEVITSARSLKKLVESLKELLGNLGHLLRGAKPGSVHTPDAPHLPDVPRHSGGTYRRRPKSAADAMQWADETYDLLRADKDFVGDLIRHNPDLDPDDIERAMKHVLEDEHLLGTGYGEPYHGRFDADEDMAEAMLRLRNGQGTDVDKLLLKHEIAESAYMKAHPGVPYEEAHAAATKVADWWKAVQEGGS